MAGGGDLAPLDVSARRRRRKQLARYVATHQQRLEKIAQRCVNRVLLTRPLDPYEALLHLLSEHTQEGICFSQLRFCPKAPSSITLEVVAEARGSTLAVHRAELPAELVERALPAGPGAAEAEASELARLQAATGRLRVLVGGALRGAKVLDFLDLDRRLQKALASSQDRAALLAALAGELLAATACLLNASTREAVRSGLELRKEVQPGPPLTCQEDLEAWEPRWPEFLLPAVQGAGPRRRFCVGAKLWAALLPEAPAAIGGSPTPTWVDPAARRAREAARLAADAADAELDDPDEIPPPDPDEHCPPTNAVAVALALADAVAAKVAAEVPSLPGDNFAPVLQAFRRALEALVPGYLRPSGGLNVEDPDREPKGPELMAVQQGRGSLFCTLHFDADAAFNPATGSYTFEQGGTARTQAELIELYASLCETEPLLRVLVEPLSPRDQGALAALRARLPAEVLVVQSPSPPDPDGAPLQPAERKSSRVEELGNLGHPRDVSLSPLSLAGHCEAQGHLYTGMCGLYDFSEHAALLPMLQAYVDVSMALPEARRCFLLPKGSGGKEPPPAMQSLDRHLCQVITSVHGQKNATDGREKARSLNAKQWKEGLRRLGYSDCDEYAEALFKFLDVSNSGTISPAELGVMQDITGPASLQELDEFRIWLCAWQAKQNQKLQEAQCAGAAAAGDGRMLEPGGAHPISPLSELWDNMDSNRSGLVSFGEFRRALRKMRHPAAMEGRDGKLQELFMCLDLNSYGNIKEEDFHCLNVLSAKFQLDRLISVRKFLKERFGTLKAAFKAMDENRSGCLTKEEWMGVMEGKQGYPNLEDCSVCFQFFDKDSGGTITGKEFEQLGAFNQEGLLSDTQSLFEHLIGKFTELEDAFAAFRPKDGPTSPSGRQSIGVKDFIEGCRSTEFKGSTDHRLLFNFLDAMHVGRITLLEFSQMGMLSAVQDLNERTALMQGAISSLKVFATEFHEGHQEGQKEEQPWMLLHQSLREATHGDLDLS